MKSFKYGYIFRKYEEKEFKSQVSTHIFQNLILYVVSYVTHEKDEIVPHVLTHPSTGIGYVEKEKSNTKSDFIGCDFRKKWNLYLIGHPLW